MYQTDILNSLRCDSKFFRHLIRCFSFLMLCQIRLLVLLHRLSASFLSKTILLKFFLLNIFILCTSYLKKPLPSCSLPCSPDGFRYNWGRPGLSCDVDRSGARHLYYWYPPCWSYSRPTMSISWTENWAWMLSSAFLYSHPIALL